MKKILTLVMCLALAITMMPSTAMAAAAVASTTGFAGGSGTETDPYIISTKAQLNNVRNDMNACYRLSNDIVFTSADFEENGDFYNEGKGWLPLGAATTSSGSETAFRGIFDGNGYAIKGLYINRASESDTGLFKYLGGQIKSLGMEDGQIIGDKRVGAIVGMVDTYAPNYERLIQNCYNTCTVTAQNGYAGGIAGEGRGTIDSCYNAGKITSVDYGCAGGIVPIMQSGTLSNCYDCGDIIGTNGSYMAGGVFGQSYSSATVSCCYSVGSQYYSTYKYGHVAGKGYVTNGSTTETSKTIDEMKQSDTYSSFDFSAVWSLSSSSSYPYPTLQSVAHASKQSSLSVNHSAVTVNEKDATCTEDGYTGDTQCEGCGITLSTGGKIEAFGHLTSDAYSYDKTSHWKVCTREGCNAKVFEEQHSGGTATLSEKAVCAVCGQKYGKYVLGTATISGSSVTARQGNEVTVELNLDENTGMTSMMIELEYDSDVLEYVSATNGEVFSDGSFDAPNSTNSSKVLIWQNGTLTKNITKTGKLATVTFKVKDEAKVGESKISFLCDSKKYEAIDAKGDAVIVTSNDAVVNVVDFLYGDVDNDKKVDSTDILVLKRYIAKWDGYTINMKNANLDGDTTEDGEPLITLRDLTILQRHLAGWKDYKVLPFVDDEMPTESQTDTDSAA